MDRTRHEYPDLDHDTIYVLKDGYKDFFERGFLVGLPRLEWLCYEPQPKADEPALSS